VIEKIVELRVHTELLEEPTQPTRKSATEDAAREKWPSRALLIDCETTTDERQSLTVGGYQYCRWTRGRYVPVETGAFYDEALDSGGVALVQAYARRNGLRAWTRSAFVKRVLWRAINAEALIVCFNAPFDLSRIACDAVWTPRRGGGWSFTLSQYLHPDTGEVREDTFKPRLIITPKDGKGAFVRLTTASQKKGTQP
jgi:hypothetical protein